MASWPSKPLDGCRRVKRLALMIVVLLIILTVATIISYLPLAEPRHVARLTSATNRGRLERSYANRSVGTVAIPLACLLRFNSSKRNWTGGVFSS